MKILRILFFVVCSIYLSNTSNGQNFIANKGQWTEPFLYQLNLPNVAVFVNPNGIRFNLVDPELHELMHDENGRHRLPEQPVKHHGLAVDFVGSTSSTIQPQGLQSTYHNYYLGKDASRWQSRVPLYNSLSISNLYTGINMILKPGGINLKYDIEVSPHADPTQITFAYRGAEKLFLRENQLVIQTSLGEIIEEAPIAWQIVDGKPIDVPVSFVLVDSLVRFKLNDYNENETLIIDPNFIFSSYTGSTIDNWGFTATYDELGNTYGGGIVFGNGYPTTLGAFQDSMQGGQIDMGISKFSADGLNLLFSTYLGGSQLEQPHSMVVDSAGHLIILGVTNSPDFPVTATAYDTSYNGGPNTAFGWTLFVNGMDMFIASLAADGTALNGATFFGGSDVDGANMQLAYNYGDRARGEILTDLSGNIYFASSTLSSDLPATDTLNGAQDAMIGKFSSNLSTLFWSNYFGGVQADAAYSLKLNSTQTALYVAGGTKSNNVFLMPHAHQPNIIGDVDGWIAQFDPATGSIIAGTYNGTPQMDQNFFVALDADDDVYVFGQTKGNYPVTSGLWGVTDGTQFIHKFKTNLQQSVRSVSFGGGQSLGSRKINISPTAFMVDGCKSIYLSGWGGNVNFEGNTNGLPITTDAYQTTTDGSDFYFLVLDGSWQFLEYGTYFGGAAVGDHVDGGTSRFSPEGIIYQAVCAGCGGNSNFPAFPQNTVSTTNNSGNCNLACLKVDFDFREAKVEININPDSVCAPFALTFDDKSTNVDVMHWDFGDGTTYTGRTPNKTFTNPGTYQFTIIGVDTLCNTSDTQTVSIFVFNSTAQAAFIANFDTCGVPYAVSFTNLSTNGLQYFWNFGDGTNSTQINPGKVYNQPGVYSVYLAVKDEICDRWDTAYATVIFKQPADELDFTFDYDPCLTSGDVVFKPTANGYHVFNWQFGDGDSSNMRFPNHQYKSFGIYEITLTAVDTICRVTKTTSQTISILNYSQAQVVVPNVFTPNNDGVNDTWHIAELTEGVNTKDFKVEVYNRWGLKVFESTNPAFAWNGKYNSNPLADGVYFWLIYVEDECGATQKNEGVVHIMR